MTTIEETIIKKLQEVDYTIDIQNEDLTPIQEFYNNSKILITGCTGFLGNILLEKLLRACSVSTIYILVRPKKGKEMNARLDELFDEPVFQRMKNHRPTFREQLVSVEGDCSMPNLGLSPEDMKRLTDEVDIVFHVAATVRFDEKLKTAVAINVRATRDLIRLAKRMPKLKSFVHVSTAFCNCVHKIIEEKIYPPALDYNILITMTESMSDDVVENITPGLLDKYPNTYTYTKQIAEDVVKQEAQDLPVGIYRPAIVVSTYKEPVRGWINNIYGPTGIGIGAGVGLLRVLHCDHMCNANMVPVDMCVNGLIVMACEIGKTFEKAKEDHLSYDIPVYNFESSNDNPINYGVVVEKSKKYGLLTPSVRAVWYYCFRVVKYYPLYLLYVLFLHTIPALIVDGVLICIGKSPQMSKAYRKIHKLSSALSYFGINNWILEYQNLRKAITKMTDRDKKIFFCDLKELDWDDFFHTYLPGSKIYLLKEPTETMPKAKKIWNRFYWAHQFVKVVLGLLLLWLMWTLFSLISTTVGL